MDPKDLAAGLRSIDISELPNSQGGTVATGLINALRSGMTLPGDVYNGDEQIRLPSESPDLTRVADLAGLMQAGALPSTKAAGEAVLGSGPIRAYHGSPHNFDRFDVSKIGTGEGAQAYGHGLYFAENPEVAQIYRDQLEARHGVNPPMMMHPDRLARDVLDTTGGDRDKALSILNERLNSYLNTDPKYQAPDGYDRFMAAMQTIRSGKEIPGGKIYEVGIHADPERFLQWDKGLAEQPQAVRDILAEHGIDPNSRLGKDLVGNPFAEAELAPMTGGEAYQRLGNKLDPWGGYEANQALAGRLNDAGIPGIRYRDRGSRGLDGVTGTHNLVVFDHDIVDILKKYGVASFAALPPAVQLAIQHGQGDPGSGS